MVTINMAHFLNLFERSQTGYFTLSLNKNADSSKELGKAKIRIWVWNEENITSLVEKEFTVSFY
jgi:hypothetical protein